MKKHFERPFIKKIRAGVPGKFGMAVHNDPVTHIDNVPVDELVNDFGSPLFVISEKTIRETIADARNAFETRYPKVKFGWSYKDRKSVV